jgi:hypothetical protein
MLQKNDQIRLSLSPYTAFAVNAKRIVTIIEQKEKPCLIPISFFGLKALVFLAIATDSLCIILAYYSEQTPAYFKQGFFSALDNLGH